jgi:hypothetical protein
MRINPPEGLFRPPDRIAQKRRKNRHGGMQEMSFSTVLAQGQKPRLFFRVLGCNKSLNTSGQTASSQGIVGPCSARIPYSQFTSAAGPFTIESFSAEEHHENVSIVTQ